jgi:hypothetical protein
MGRCKLNQLYTIKPPPWISEFAIGSEVSQNVKIAQQLNLQRTGKFAHMDKSIIVSPNLLGSLR